MEGTLQLSHSEAEGDSLEEGVIEPVVEEELCLRWGATPFMVSLSNLPRRSMSSRLLRVWPGDLSYRWVSGGGRGMCGSTSGVSLVAKALPWAEGRRERDLPLGCAARRQGEGSVMQRGWKGGRTMGRFV